MTYKCKCMKCAREYESEDPRNLDGDGLCHTCLEEKNIIVAAVNEKLEGKVSRAKPPLDIDALPRIPGTDYIHSKYIL